MVDYQLVFYTGLPIFLLAVIYFLFGWGGLFECIGFSSIIFVIFVLFIILARKKE
jgi:hypothetical protein